MNFESKNPMQNDNENEFEQDFPDINVYGDCLTEDPNREYTCCICGEECVGYGNDPEPYKHSGRCCDACNKKFVIPARAEQLAADLHGDNEEKEEE